jgi:hypothetical protein
MTNSDGPEILTMSFFNHKLELLTAAGIRVCDLTSKVTALIAESNICKWSIKINYTNQEKCLD